MKYLLSILSIALAVVALFVFAIIGAGSHGNMGLFNHADSFFLYSIVLLLLTGSVFLILFSLEGYSESPNRTLRHFWYALAYVLVAILVYVVGAFSLEVTSGSSAITSRDYYLLIGVITSNLLGHFALYQLRRWTPA